MKTPSDNLYKLIKSLNSHEKRHFKMFVKKGQPISDYIILFDVIDNLKQYDEEKIKLLALKKGKITNLIYVKNYLLETILNFLEHHYSSHSNAIIVQRLLQRVEVLCEKKLYDLARTNIQKAEKIASKNSLHFYLPQILFWKRDLAFAESNVKIISNYLNDFHLPQLRSLQNAMEVVEYQNLTVRIRMLILQREQNPTNNITNKITKLINNKLLQNEESATTYQSKYLRSRILGECLSFINEFDKSSFHFKNAIEYFEKAAILPEARLSTYSRFISSLSRSKKQKDFLLIKNNAINYFKSLTLNEKSKRLNSDYAGLIINCMDFFISNGDINDAFIHGEEVSQWFNQLDKTEIEPRSYTAYYANMFLIYFYQSNYRKALLCLNKLESLENIKIVKGIVYQVKLYALIIHYELDNDSMLTSLYRSVTNQIKKNRKSAEFEKTILRFFNKIITNKNESDSENELLLQLKRDLRRLNNNKIFYVRDFISWADSKIENRPFIEILKEKNR